MSKYNIMLCLVRLDIGGLETHVLNQTKELISRGYNVVIVAKNGIYTEKAISLGATCIDFEFDLSQKYDIEKAKQIEEIIKQYEINEVHIHQFDCITSVFPACICTNTPYVAYAHTGIKGVYNWFENTYRGYDAIFNMYFKLAKKIVTITEEAVIENKEKYGIDEEKYIIVHNSIDFEELKETIIPKKIQNFMIISRFTEEKRTSLKNSVDIFKSYLKENENAFLTIVGDGELSEFIKQEIEDIKEHTNMLGARNDVIDIIKQNDVVIGLDRCILETIASKKIAIVSGYDGNINVIVPENIEKAANLNFSGRNLENKEIPEIIKFLKSLNEQEIEKIVNYNYEFALKNLNIKDNIYVLDTNNENIDYFSSQYLYFEVINNLIIQREEERKNGDNIYAVKQENEEKFIKTIEELQIKNQKLEEENNEKDNLLNSIYNSKRWRYVENAKNIINKFKGKNK